MSNTLLLHWLASALIFVLLIGEWFLARPSLSKPQAYALMGVDLLYNLMIYLAIGTGILLIIFSPEPWLEQLKNPWLLGKLALLVVIASICALPSWLIFSLREQFNNPSPIIWLGQKRRWLRLVLGGEWLLFAAIAALSGQPTG